MMKKIAILCLFATVIISCKETTKYPKELAKVFAKHGGIVEWNKLEQLSFQKGKETHLVDMHSRKSLITAANYTIGYDGNKAWLKEKDSFSFKGNKDFYYNLFFYFYAMPFVLADDGIMYEEAKPLEFENQKYPGYKISFKANVGTSPDDNYYVYYNPDTFQMEWLQYTVTFFDKKPSEKVNTIRYNDWEKVGSFLLPKSITWYKKGENGFPTKPSRPAIVFTRQTVSQEKISEIIFQEPKE